MTATRTRNGRSPAADRNPLARTLEALALAGFVTLFYTVPDGASTWVLGANLAAFYILFLRAIASPDRILPTLPTYLSIEVLFFTFSYLIFYHPYQMFLLEATDLSVSRYVLNSYVDGSNKGITLATVGMLAFAIGYRTLGQAHRNGGFEPDPAHHKSTENNDGTPPYFHAMASGASALLVTLATLYLLAGWHSAGEGRYTGATTASVGTEGVATAILMFCMIVAALWVYARAAHLRTPPMLTIGLLAAVGWIMRLLLLGDRSSFLLFALVLAGGYFTFVRRASLFLLVIAFGLWVFVYNIIEVLRFIPNWYSAGNFWTLVQQSQDYQDKSGESSFNITTMTLRATVEVVPSSHDYTYGLFKVIQVTSAVPFSGKLYLPYFDLEYTNSAVMLRDIMLGSRSPWDPGTNVISDSYIEFGLPGVVLILFATGLMATVIRNYVGRDPYDPNRVVVYLLTMALFAELPRYAIDLPIRVLVWALVFSAVTRAVSGRLRTRAPNLPASRTSNARLATASFDN